MKYNHFSLLPIHAFQPRPFGGMTLEGGAVDFVEDVVGGAVDAVGNIVSGIGDVISDVGSAVDDAVNDVIPGGWGTVAAVTIAATTGIPTDFGITEAAAAEAAGAAGSAATTAAELGTAVDALDLYNAATIGTEGLGAAETAAGALSGGIDLGGAAYDAWAPVTDYITGPLEELSGLEQSLSIPGASPATELAAPITDLSIPYDPVAANAISTTQGLTDLAQAIGQTVTQNPLQTIKTINTIDNLYNTLTHDPTSSIKRTMPFGTQFAGSSLLNPLGSGTPVAGGLPGSLEANVLAAAPVTSTPPSPMNLLQLKQLYPQLSTIDPRLLQMLTNKTSEAPGYYTYGAGADQASATGDRTAFSLNPTGGLPTAGYPSIAADRLARSRMPGEIPDYMGSGPLTQQGLSMLAGRSTYGFAEGGITHRPEFITGATGHYVQGRGDGQSDDIPAMLADGEYVFDADTVAALGNGSNKAGAAVLDKMRENVRKHKRSASHKEIPPKAKSPLAYMKG